MERLRNWQQLISNVCLVVSITLLTTVVIDVTALKTASAAQAQAQAQAQGAVFTDIRGHWAKDEIEAMVNQGILDGYPDGSFRPNEPVKVDQFIKMLVLSYSEQHPNQERSWKGDFLNSLTNENRTILKQDYRYFNFKPAMTGYWAKPYIDVASDLNFLNKSRYSDFQADMTRENVAEILYYTLQETEFLEDEQFSRSIARSYGDLTSATDREQRFIGESLVKGIMKGYPDGKFGVGQYVTRAESLVLLNRLIDSNKRIPVQPEAEKLQRVVPTVGGGKKIVVFPDKTMWDMYMVLQQAGQLRGSNHDLLDTTLRLYKDEKEKKAVQQATATSTTAFTAASTATEEVAIWLDPNYSTYGITVHLRDGALARNQESIELFANQLFTYDAIAFHRWFASICAEVEAGRPLASSKQASLGDYAIHALIDNSAKTVIFTIAAKK